MAHTPAHFMAFPASTKNVALILAVVLPPSLNGLTKVPQHNPTALSLSHTRVDPTVMHITTYLAAEFQVQFQRAHLA